MIKSLEIRKMKATDAQAVLRIYAEGIATGHATFEEKAPDWQKWDSGHLPQCRWIAENKQQILGWGALSGVSSRCVYSGVAEVSIYISGVAQNQGVGSKLLECLIDSSEEAGIWTLQAQTFPENKNSIGLHEKHGFRQIGIRERIAVMTYGQSAGKWRDVVLMERRSKKVGI